MKPTVPTSFLEELRGDYAAKLGDITNPIWRNHCESRIEQLDRYIDKPKPKKPESNIMCVVDGHPVHKNREVVWDSRKDHWNMFVVGIEYDFFGRTVLVSPDGRRLLHRYATYKRPNT